MLIWFLSLFAIACGGDEGVPKSWGKGIYVPEQWQTAREVSGHATHVLENAVPCSECHDLSQGEVGSVTPQACANCHEKEAKSHHARGPAQKKFGPEVTSDCTTCHIFKLSEGAHPQEEGDVFKPGDCLRCHERSQGNLDAVVVHQPGDCLACHVPHSESGPKSAPCASCHEDVSTFHTAERKDPVRRCTTCHSSQHAPARQARDSCTSCHFSKEPMIPQSALFAEGHASCISCHRPHDGKDAEPVGCATCHEDVHVLGSHLAAPHRNCENCHNPHDVRAASASGCANCHESVRPDHPKHGKVGTCTGCHDPHPARDTFKKVRACTTCHAAAPTDTGFHGETSCRSCHQPHSFRLATAGLSLCANCHQDNVTDVKAHSGHQSCNNCHGGLPHQPGRLDKSCGSCHGEEAAEVRSGHRDCLSCHDAHDQNERASCASCHVTEHRLAPEGHSDCTSCHQPHSGARSSGLCASCHKQEAGTPHGKIGEDCSTCHRPHGPGAVTVSQTCSSCHKQESLPGMHHLGQHQTCVTCHSSHGEELGPQRPICLSCHTDKKEHYPSAPTCSSCHLFVPAK